MVRASARVKVWVRVWCMSIVNLRLGFGLCLGFDYV
jgi:hypothetical protein